MTSQCAAAETLAGAHTLIYLVHYERAPRRSSPCAIPRELEINLSKAR